jgi:hypothetical protein
MANEREI